MLGRLAVDVGFGLDFGGVRGEAVVVVVLVDGGFADVVFVVLGGGVVVGGGPVVGLGGLVVDGLVGVGPVGGGVVVGGAVVEGGGALVVVGGGFGVCPACVVTGEVVDPAGGSSFPKKKKYAPPASPPITMSAAASMSTLFIPPPRFIFRGRGGILFCSGEAVLGGSSKTKSPDGWLAGGAADFSISDNGTAGGSVYPASPELDSPSPILRAVVSTAASAGKGNEASLGGDAGGEADSPAKGLPAEDFFNAPVRRAEANILQTSNSPKAESAPICLMDCTPSTKRSTSPALGSGVVLARKLSSPGVAESTESKEPNCSKIHSRSSMRRTLLKIRRGVESSKSIAPLGSERSTNWKVPSFHP